MCETQIQTCRMSNKGRRERKTVVKHKADRGLNLGRCDGCYCKSSGFYPKSGDVKNQNSPGECISCGPRKAEENPETFAHQVNNQIPVITLWACYLSLVELSGPPPKTTAMVRYGAQQMKWGQSDSLCTGIRRRAQVTTRRHWCYRFC